MTYVTEKENEVLGEYKTLNSELKLPPKLNNLDAWKMKQGLHTSTMILRSQVLKIRIWKINMEAVF